MSCREEWLIGTAPHLHHRRQGDTDTCSERHRLAEEAHQVALGRPGQGVIETATVAHTPAAVDALIARIPQLETDPAEVRVVLETRHGLLVERLIEAGYTVVPVNPDLIARRRGPADKKDDPEDARIACLLTLDRFAQLKPLIPHGEMATEPRAIARDDKDERRLLNRLRVDLLAVFPAALDIAGDDPGAPTLLKLLQRWLTPAQLRSVSRDELDTFARSCHQGWPDRFADKTTTAPAADHFVAPPALMRAKADTIRLHATQLLALGSQRRAWQKPLGQLLIGEPTGGDQPGQWLPDGEIYLPMPGLAVPLAASVAGEIADHPTRFDAPDARQAYGGKAPVTRRCGKSESVVATRLACNRHPHDTVQNWAF